MRITQLTNRRAHTHTEHAHTPLNTGNGLQAVFYHWKCSTCRIRCINLKGHSASRCCTAAKNWTSVNICSKKSARFAVLAAIWSFWNQIFWCVRVIAGFIFHISIFQGKQRSNMVNNKLKMKKVLASCYRQINKQLVFFFYVASIGLYGTYK